jgi:hypothetical protein
MSLLFLKGNTMYYFDKLQEHINDTAPCSSRWDGYDRGDTYDDAYALVDYPHIPDWNDWDESATTSKKETK